ncbi:hypothetical protein ACFYQA_36630 [Streptomyces sp. NPDC005774]|uniref:hypothetical protein n=1 Tax=Streptomyces sp. NPDC005774 TaxID=3364728 RepID=UPI003674BD42
MLTLAAQMLRHRKGSFVGTFVALAAGVAVLMACVLLVESGRRYHGESQRYAKTVAVVADRDLTLSTFLAGQGARSFGAGVNARSRGAGQEESHRLWGDAASRERAVAGLVMAGV